MCGRFTQASPWRELVTLYGLTQPAMNLQPRYNIAPTTNIDVLIPRGADRLELWPMRWGLIPWWWEKTVKGGTCPLHGGSRDNHRQADVSRCPPGTPLHHPGVGLLRVEADGNRQAALLRFRARRLDTALRRPMGRMARP